MRINRIIGYVFIVLGVCLYVHKNMIDRNNIVFANNKIDYTLASETNYRYKNNDLYNMVLSIPKINLKKGIYAKGDYRNNIDSNVMIHDYANYPDQDNSNVILLAHSGTGEKAYFKNLNKLNSDSLIELFYNHVKYVYKVDHFYSSLKNGQLDITFYDKKTITLITCDQKDKDKYLIYVGYIIDEIAY